MYHIWSGGLFTQLVSGYVNVDTLIGTVLPIAVDVVVRNNQDFGKQV